MEAAAATGHARLVGTVAAQEDADVHLVGLPLHPPEEAVDPVPAVVLPEFLGSDVSSTLSLDHELLVAGREFLEWKMDVDVVLGAGLEQVALAFT